jgi:hypothetical protein
VFSNPRMSLTERERQNAVASFQVDLRRSLTGAGIVSVLGLSEIEPQRKPLKLGVSDGRLEAPGAFEVLRIPRRGSSLRFDDRA